MAIATCVLTCRSWFCMSRMTCLIIFSGSSALSIRSLRLARTRVETRSSNAIRDSLKSVVGSQFLLLSSCFSVLGSQFLVLSSLWLSIAFHTRRSDGDSRPRNLCGTPRWFCRRRHWLGLHGPKASDHGFDLDISECISLASQVGHFLLPYPAPTAMPRKIPARSQITM